ncbi:hypothetical protein L195_g047535, partial [Trifolium pratense]
QLGLVEIEEEWKIGGEGATRCDRRWMGYEMRPALMHNAAAVAFQSLI